MEAVLSNGFQTLTESEMEMIDGGEANVVQAIGGTLGAAAVCWAPVALLAGVAPIAVAGIVLVGAGAFINMASSAAN